MTTDAKICGIKTQEALDAAIAGGARYVGLVFAVNSPRHVDFDTAERLAAAARGKIKVVALTVDADDATLAEIAARVRPDMLQLHGRETPQRVTDVKRRFGVPVIKAIPVADINDVRGAQRYLGIADMILFDAKAPKGAARAGGHGAAFDWQALEGAPEPGAFMLAGGLTPETVADAIRRTKAAAVDVSSGVERSPGEKDAELIRRFLAAVKTANQA